MRDRAYAVLGLALLVALGLLLRISPGGERELAAGAVVLLLGALTTPEARKRRRGLAWDLASVLGPALAATIALAGLLELVLAMHAPPVLAWFARILCLTATVLLFRTPPQALVLHGLAVVLALWTASALRGALDPGIGLITVRSESSLEYGSSGCIGYCPRIAHNSISRPGISALVCKAIAPETCNSCQCSPFVSSSK